MSPVNAWPFPHGTKWEKDLQRKLAKYFEEKDYPSLSPSRRYVLRDHADWRKNILLSAVLNYVEEEIRSRSQKNPFPLHKWIHHGLSSQVLLFNLLGPLVVGKQWNISDEILREAGIGFPANIVGAELETEDEHVFKEYRGQPTSIDLCLHTKTGEDVFIEFKFTEKNFGGCSVFANGDCDGKNPANDFSECYLHHIGCTYWDLMRRYGLLTEQMRSDSWCPFSTLYQAYRVILFSLEKRGHFLLLYDSRNPSFVAERINVRRGLFYRVYESLPENVKDRCHSLSTQSVVSILQKHPELDWVDEVVAKYYS
ncbi:MAG: hypothetical protein HYX85_00230 [Chloroflexi bacterium]|nr:hypothetical protein [Chloroflexota bacterium]